MCACGVCLFKCVLEGGGEIKKSLWDHTELTVIAAVCGYF